MTSMQMDGAPLSSGPTQTGSSKLGKAGQESELLAAIVAQRELEEKKKAWASWVDAEFVKCKNARSAFERQWFINLAFVMGKHYLSPIEIAGQGFRLTTPKAPPWRVRLVVNFIRPAVLRELAKLTSSRPMPTVVPSTNEGEDFSAAQVGEALIKARFAYAEFEEQYRDWIWWGIVCGVSFIKQWWDGSAKDYDSMALPEPITMPDGSPVPEDMLAMIPGAQEYMQTLQPAVGRICAERVNPFHMYVPDLLSKRLESQPYVIQVMTRHPDWVKKAYNLESVTPDSRAAATVMDAASLITKGMEEHLDSVIVKEMWLKPNAHPDFPEGGVLTIVNSKVVQVAEKWPLPYPEYPYYKYDGIPTGGFYSDSSIVDLVSLNKEYNRSRSQMMEIKNTMGKPKIVYAHGSINPRKISSEPGQSIPYTAGYPPPQIMPGTDVPSTFYQELEILRRDFDDISGQHEISRGQTPKDVTSGTAIAFLQEQDDSLLSAKVSSIELACQFLGKHYLHLVSTYWDDQRVVKVTGKNQEYEAIHWKKDALRGNMDVRIQTGSALPVSKAAKQALVTEWMQNGFLDPVTGMEVLDVGDLSKVADELLVDKKQAQRENLKMADVPAQLVKLLLNPAPGPNGEQPTQVPNPQDPTQPPVTLNGDGTPFQPQPPVPVNSWDNHEAHIQWHNHFRKTQEFELMAEENKQVFEMHVQMHQMSMMGMQVNPSNQMVAEPQAPVQSGPPGFPEEGVPPQPNSMGAENQVAEQGGGELGSSPPA
jgi:hypothetical protein